MHMPLLTDAQAVNKGSGKSMALTPGHLVQARITAVSPAWLDVTVQAGMLCCATLCCAAMCRFPALAGCQRLSRCVVPCKEYMHKALHRLVKWVLEVYNLLVVSEQYCSTWARTCSWKVHHGLCTSSKLPWHVRCFF